MTRVLLILKEPFLDRIPSLKTLVLYLLQTGKVQMTILTSKSEKFIGVSFSHPNLKVVQVHERTRRLEFPTVAKVLLKANYLSLRHNYDVVLGGDFYGNVIAHKLFFSKHSSKVFFMLEYPDIDRDDIFCLMERRALRNADIVITHDIWHQRFLHRFCGMENSKCLLLPNSTFTECYREQSHFLHQRLHINENCKLILHSGGFGEWFQCKQLADTVKDWPTDCYLVFHTSHSMAGNDYYQSVKSESNERVLFSDKPVDTEMLDCLVASGSIGLAFYDEEKLGYKATYMGVAAGKIGSYLKCGVPVIATKLPSLQYIEDYKCGVLVEDFTEIAGAIEKILETREQFSRNAFKCYEELWHPAKYLAKIKDAILKT